MNPSRYIEHLEIGCEADEVLGDHNDGLIEIDSKSDDDQETTDTDDDRYVDDVTQKADFVGYDFVSNIHRRGSEGQDLTSIILVHSFYDLHGLLN